MGNAIDNLVRIGSKALLAGVMFGLVGCTPRPIVRARQDYHEYPAYKKEIALDNIKRILNDNCTATVDTEGFKCSKLYCTRTERVCGAPVSQYDKTRSCWDRCANYDHRTFEKKWDEIHLVRSRERCLEFDGSDKCAIYLRSDAQARDLQEAIEIYIKNH